jgi:hypothetical protein
MAKNKIQHEDTQIVNIKSAFHELHPKAINFTWEKEATKRISLLWTDNHYFICEM